MLDKLKEKLTWQIVVLLLGGGGLFALIAIFAPPDVRTVLFGTHGFIMTVLGWLIASPLEDKK